MRETYAGVSLSVEQRSRLNVSALRLPLSRNSGALRRMSRWIRAGGFAFAMQTGAAWASASDVSHAADHHGLDGALLPLTSCLPFVGMLLSIALMPLCAPRFWHRHDGKICFAWSLALLVPLAATISVQASLATVVHAVLSEYMPFIVLLTALYTVAGGISVRGNLHGTPAVNTAMLAVGTALASVMGTTGAAMLMIRPVLRANDNRTHRVHVVVFFIFLVANAGGALTPLGDPPLFIGFLNGVTFAWTASHLLLPLLLVSTLLLAVFYVTDRFFYRQSREERAAFLDPTPDSRMIWLEGKRNIPLLALISAAVLMSGIWQPGIAFEVMGTRLELQNLVRDALLVGITLISLFVTPRPVREHNAFNWAPIKEVAKLFAGIFITIAPVIALLHAGERGALAGLSQWVSHADGTPDTMKYFWVTGVLSSFLDNAPTYLVFFNLAGGDAHHLMTDGAATLAAVSAGSVFMGAMTYLGNAPNFMVRSIAQSRGIVMPGFFGYMLWSGAILIPVFAMLSAVFFL